MGSFRLSKAAWRDLLAIGRYTRELWGEEQCRSYLTVLDSRFRTIAKSPTSGRVRDDLSSGYRSWREGRHVIYYRVTRKGVDIIRILHERMLPQRHLR